MSTRTTLCMSDAPNTLRQLSWLDDLALYSVYPILFPHSFKDIAHNDCLSTHGLSDLMLFWGQQLEMELGHADLLRNLRRYYLNREFEYRFGFYVKDAAILPWCAVWKSSELGYCFMSEESDRPLKESSYRLNVDMCIQKENSDWNMATAHSHVMGLIEASGND
jgi:hypothetical protein